MIYCGHFYYFRNKLNLNEKECDFLLKTIRIHEVHGKTGAILRYVDYKIKKYRNQLLIIPKNKTHRSNYFMMSTEAYKPNELKQRSKNNEN